MTKRKWAALWGLLPLALMLLLFALAPLYWIFVNSLRTDQGWSLQRFQDIAGDAFFRQAFSNSLEVSLWSSLIALIIVIFAAAALRRVPGRIRNTVVAITTMSANLTGVPLAFAYIILMGTNGALTLLIRQSGLPWIFDLYTESGLILIYTYFQLPLGLLLLYPAFEQLDDTWQQASSLLGAKSWQYWRYIGLPVLLPSVLGTFILMFANAMGAYASAFALMQGSFNLITVRIASLVAGDLFLEPELAAALSVYLTLLLLIITLAQQYLMKRGRYGAV